VETKNCQIPYMKFYFEIYGDVGLAYLQLSAQIFIAPCTYYPSVTMILLIDG